jgi:hypothetical protein
MPSLNPASARAFSNPLASASKSGKETVWVTPILGIIFLDVFSWAKEKEGETISRRIEIERSLLTITNFFFQSLNYDTHLGTLNA